MNYHREFTDMKEVYPKRVQSKSGKIKVEHFQLTKDQVEMASLRSAINGRGWMSIGLKPDFTYIRFLREGQVWMSDTPMEKNSNRDFINRAFGDVLIFGLGMGLVLPPLLEASEVTSITIMEIDKEVINLVIPQFNAYTDISKLKVIHGDAWEDFDKLPDGKKYHSIYFDIWGDICSDNWEEIVLLKNKYRDYLFRSKDQFYKAWIEERIKALHNEERARINYLGPLGGSL